VVKDSLRLLCVHGAVVIVVKVCTQKPHRTTSPGRYKSPPPACLADPVSVLYSLDEARVEHEFGVLWPIASDDGSNRVCAGLFINCLAPRIKSWIASLHSFITWRLLQVPGWPWSDTKRYFGTYSSSVGARTIVIFDEERESLCRTNVTYGVSMDFRRSRVLI
jgi:hypothetical protein